VEVPGRVGEELVAANDTCISVGTYPSDDGDTEICLAGTSSVEKVAGLEKVFTGRVASPNQQIDVATAENEILLSMKVSTKSASVSVWVNHPRWPTKIVIVVNDRS
jgi:hypothetical protein